MSELLKNVDSMRFISASAEETRAAGRILGSLLQAGNVVFLVGEMGSGKTCFTQGIGEALRGEEEMVVTSPSYTLLNVYPGRLDLCHFDLFRLDGEMDLEDIGFEECLNEQVVTVVEWAERIDYRSREGISVHFSYLGDERRQLVFVAQGERSTALLENFCVQFKKERS